MKLYIYITDIQAYLRGDYGWCFDASSRSDLHQTTIYALAGEVEVELGVDENKLRQKAVETIEEKEKIARAEFQVVMDRFKDEKQNLLAISHDS